jgi:hypothetical protein
MRWTCGRAAAMVVLVALSLIAGCSPSQGSEPSERIGTTAPPSTPSALIPDEGLPPHIACLEDRGFSISVDPPTFEGGRPAYHATSDLPPEEAAAAIRECSTLAPGRTTLSEAEIREVYDRWVREWECLKDLGYRPLEPPTVETFVAQWKTGPWSPIDGIDTNAWTDTDYRLAKDRCTLEMFHRD